MGMEFESKKRPVTTDNAKLLAELEALRTKQAQQIADLQEMVAEQAEQGGAK